MRKCAVVASAAYVFLVAGASSSDGQSFPNYRPPHMADGHPDLNGIWQAMVTANWDLQDHEAQAGPHPEIMGEYGAGPAGQSIVEGGEIPYLPSGLQKKKQNSEQRATVDVSSDKRWHELGDPELKCYMPGVPRATYMPFPFRIVQGSSSYILMAYEYASATRIVRMNTQQEAPTPSWMGWSRGHWEGDTLVVDVTGFREETWFDRAGDFHSEELHVVERYTPASPYHLIYEATIEDPQVYSRPWKISFPLYRRMEKNVQLLEFKCAPFTEELLYGGFSKTGGEVNNGGSDESILNCDSYGRASGVDCASSAGCEPNHSPKTRSSRGQESGGESQGVAERGTTHPLGRPRSPRRLERRDQHSLATS